MSTVSAEVTQPLFESGRAKRKMQEKMRKNKRRITTHNKDKKNAPARQAIIECDFCRFQFFGFIA
jgi:hypothetical protein